MTAPGWFLAAAMLVATLVAWLSRRRSVYKAVATALLLFSLIACSIFIDAAARGVVAAANAQGEFSPEFLLGVERLRDSLFVLRWLLTLAAFSLYLLVMLPLRHAGERKKPI
jgi:hypothetical protein